MCGALVAPVCDEHGTVRSGFAINRSEGHVVGFEKRAALIDNPAVGNMASFEAFVGNVIEITEGIRVVQRAVFAEAFDIITALDLVQSDLLAKIRAGDDVAVLVKIKAPCVSTTFGEQLELVR